MDTTASLSVCISLFPDCPLASSTSHLLLPLSFFLLFCPFLPVILSPSPFLGAASTTRALGQELGGRGERWRGRRRSWGGAGRGGEIKVSTDPQIAFWASLCDSGRPLPAAGPRGRGEGGTGAVPVGAEAGPRVDRGLRLPQSSRRELGLRNRGRRVARPKTGRPP